jgi:2-C-methyl-D-erythritol 4-phosphate cytidylyltransferase
MHVYVIVPAAGIGTRMAMSHPAGGISPLGANANPAAPKQFLTIGGVPVLIHSLRAFLAVERVSAIYVAVRASETERMKTHVSDFGLGEKVHVVEGGENRQDSVGRALAAVGKDFGAEADDVVLVHDAVRPLIDPATIDRTIDAIVKHGAAIVGLPAVDTIKQVERTANGALVTSTIPRERVVYAQTPQGALYAGLKRAFDEAAADEFLGTDEASLLERAGVPVVVVAGSARNFKITQPGDLELAEFYLKRHE